MSNLFDLSIIILIAVCAFSVTYGTNLKSWYGWVQVLSGFLLGILIGSPQNMIGQLVTGVFFALLIILLGPVVWRRRHS